MQTESLGKLLPRILFPYAQQWAERAGFALLSRLLVDDQFRDLIEKYSNELVILMAKAGSTTLTNGNGHGRGGSLKPVSQADWRTDGLEPNGGPDLATLQDRVLAMEAAQQAQQALFEALRTKIRPLALALGCCPECLVGIDACPRCWGRSGVGHYQPDYALLDAQVVGPLAACGVPLVLERAPSTDARRRRSKPSATKKGSKSWPKK
jgi:hypothetical protein